MEEEVDFVEFVLLSFLKRYLEDIKVFEGLMYICLWKGFVVKVFEIVDDLFVLCLDYVFW